MLFSPFVSNLLGFPRPPESEAPESAQAVSADQPIVAADATADKPLTEDMVARHGGATYLAPSDLSRTEVSIQRILLIGECLTVAWIKYIERDGLAIDYIVTNNFSPLPEEPPAPIDDYDFQIVQVPLRAVLHENTYSHLPHGDTALYEDLFAKATSWLSRYLDVVLAWNTKHGLQSFVTNFMVPQQSPLGRLLPRDDLRNMVHFIERLNAHLYRDIARRTNVHLLDIDQIAASIGRRRIQDDGVWTLSHGGTLNDSEYERDRERIVPVPAMSAHYPVMAEGERQFYEAAWSETVAMVRTLRQIDSVKLVVFDLDDTLWRGVIAEENEISADNIEGWPVGLMEAVCFLKKRGILLAIVSRNEESRIVSLFDRIAGGRLHLDAFAARRINWQPKTENMAEILEEVHLTPQNVVFVDDNPVERAAMEAHFPGLRCLGAHPYYLRRILLWSAETQVPFISEESERRTEMVQAQITRDQESGNMSREEFLATLGLRMKIIDIRSTQDERFRRAFELINKTNQFNTTGRRLGLQACAKLFAVGGQFTAFELQDRFSQYGLVGVAIVESGHISQFVMSCRVLGLGAEDVLLAHLAERAAAAGQKFISADYTATNLNAPARDLYARGGFVERDGIWWGPTAPPQLYPSHIELLREPVTA